MLKCGKVLLSELANYAPKPGVVWGNAAFGDLDIYNPIFKISHLVESKS